MVDYTDYGDELAGQTEVTHYLRDILGSVVALTNSNGEVVERYTYDPYGTTYIEDANTTGLPASKYGNTIMWTGQHYDPATGLYLFHARAYSPRLGRWLQPDPLGYIDGMNRYQYVGSMPTAFVDPFGMSGVLCGAGQVASGLLKGIGSVLKGIGTAVAHPIETAEAIGRGAAEVYTNARNDGDTVAGAVAHVTAVGAVKILGGDAVLNIATGQDAAGNPLDLEGYATEATVGVINIAAVAIPAAKAVSAVRAGGSASVTVYRVEGVPNTRILVSESGSVAIQGDSTLFVNVGNGARAQAFLAKRLQQGMAGATIKTFEVPRSFLTELQRTAVPEASARLYPNSPIVVDVTKASNQFGLRAPQIQRLNEVIIPRTGSVGP